MKYCNKKGVRNLRKSKSAFGDAASTLIMFIAVISVTTGLVIAFSNYIKTTEHSFNYQNKLTSNKLRTSISITNVYYNDTSEQLYIYVKNVGETKLQPQLFDVFIDQGFTNNFTAYYADNLTKQMDYFDIQETAAIVKDITLTTGSHTVKVNSEYGVGDEEYFNT